MKKVIIILILLAFSLVVIVIHFDLNELRQNLPDDYKSYYIPPSPFVKIASLGNRLTAADLLFIWSIQYYDFYKSDVRTQYLKHTMDVITDLDEHFTVAYILGAIFFFAEKDFPDLYTLLDKGIDKNPKDWMLPWDAGTYAFFSEKNYQKSTQYFQIALKRNPNMTILKKLVANSLKYASSYEKSLEYWYEILNQYGKGRDPVSQRYEIVAKKNIHDLKIKIDLRNLKNGIDKFNEIYGFYPPNLQFLIKKKILDQIPIDPEGKPYIYKSASGEVACITPFNFKKANEW